MFLKLKLLFQNLAEEFLNLVYNQKCLICSCSKTNDLLCKNCAKDVHFMAVFPHTIYKSIKIYSAVLYQGNVKKLIHLLKFSHKKKAAKPLADLLFNFFLKLNFKKNYTIIFPPSFYLKSSERGYNHMFLIAKEFSKLSGLSINSNLIKKIKYTKPQYKAKNRRKNVKGSYGINKKYIKTVKDKNILLIDDITTSGSTLEEIIDCLLDNGIKNITALTVAKAHVFKKC